MDGCFKGKLLHGKCTGEILINPKNKLKSGDVDLGMMPYEINIVKKQLDLYSVVLSDINLFCSRRKPKCNFFILHCIHKTFCIYFQL